MYDTCPACGSQDLHDSISFRAPVFCNVLYKTKEEALQATQGDFQGTYCGKCGHFFNRIFDQTLLEYTEDYDTSLHFSPKFQVYATTLAQHLISTYDLRDKSIIEIGCGRGDFLRLLCEGQGNQGHGFDTSYDDRQTESAEFLTFYREYFDESHDDISADFIVCRHVLEHVDNPLEFLERLRAVPSFRSDTVLYFEVPNGVYSLKDLGVWDFIYEHFSYFNSHSLRVIFERAGFRVLDLREAFGGQYLCIEVECGSGESQIENLSLERNLKECLSGIQRSFKEKINQWQDLLSTPKKEGGGFAVWGAGSKGVSFVNFVGGAEFLVDLNPGKQGRFTPGTGLEVRSPDSLLDREVAAYIVMNPNYKDEIAAELKVKGIEASIMVA